MATLYKAVQVYQFNDCEDGQTYFWNATAGHELTATHELYEVDLVECGFTLESLKTLCPELDVWKARSLPLEALLSPLLFVTHKGKHVLIDGWHRLFRALEEQVEILPAWILSQEEADRIRV